MFVTGLAAVALAVAIVILRRRPTAQSSPEMAFTTRCNIRKIRPRGTLPSSAEPLMLTETLVLAVAPTTTP